MYISMKKQLNIYSSAIAPRQLLLRCPNKLHPCNDALPYYLPSMAVSAIAPRQLLLRCPNKLHPCNDALPYYLPSMAVSAIAPRQLLLRCPTTVHPWTYALSYYRPSMDICVVLLPSIHGHMHCPGTTTMDGGSADIAGANICLSVHPWQYQQ